MNARELRARRAALIDQAKAIMATATNGALSAEQRTQFDALMSQAETIKADIERADRLDTEVGALDQSTGTRAARSDDEVSVPALNLKTRRGDTENRALAHYLRTGDRSRELRANANDMTVADATYAGYTVPTGHYQNIVAKRDTVALFNKLGVMNVVVKGTTGNVPFDNGTANAFVSTAETTAFDLDAPVVGQAAMTLVKYTKKVTISDELLEDEDSNLIEFLENYVGRALALTENSLLVTEALANGTSNTLGATAAATATDVTTLMYSLKGEYADNAQWIMARATEGAFRALTSSTPFLFVPTPQGSMTTLWGAPVNNSAAMPAIGSGNKSILFGNFNLMARREGKGMQVLRDPYSGGGTGQVNIYYYVRLVYKVLVAEAIRYGKHTTT